MSIVVPPKEGEILGHAESDTAGFAAACRRHGLTFHRDSPWTAELWRRFNLA
jgi:hypothetical protein